MTGINLSSPLSILDKGLTGVDVASILKAFDTLSGEVEMGKLLEKLMVIFIENTGARQGQFFLKEADHLLASSKIDIENQFQLLSASVEDSQGIAKSIVHHVEHTREWVVLGNAAHTGSFTHDSHVIANQAKSILCLPIILREDLLGILYLENNIATDAFAPEQLPTLNLIAAQIGVSIENVRRYQYIVNKMDERTYELNEKTEMLGLASEILEQTNTEMAQEIEQRKQLEQELRKLATTDYLTGLLIRRQFFDLGAKEITRARRSGSALSLMILDIDHFKSVNDTHGHAIGDEVLKHFAATFQSSLRSIDIVCRFGGEEFVAMLPDTNIELAREVAQRLRHNVEASAVPLETGELKYTVSIGLTGLQEEDTQANQLINRADEALYEAKKSGRNRVVIAS